MSDRTIEAPHDAASAAAALDDLHTHLETARTFARQYGTAADRAEHLYRRESAKAWMKVDGRNADERAGRVHEWPLTDDALTDSAEVAEASGMSATPCRTVGELRWLRDRAVRLAEQWSATAYDRRALISAWMTVASMAKSEAELAGQGPRLREVGS